MKKLALPPSVLGRAEEEYPDWVFMTTGVSEDDLPGKIRPLLMRRQPVVPGEKLFVLGVPYRSAPNPRQNVYTARAGWSATHSFRFELDPEHQGVKMAGFSGAPILDARGYVVGTVGTRAGQGIAIAPMAVRLEGGKFRRPLKGAPGGGKKEPSTPGKEPSTPDRKEPSTPGGREPSTPRQAGDPRPARLVVHLPAQARLWIEGERTRSVSSRREFLSPPLLPGGTYRYALRAELLQAGQRRTRG
jgi:uncharacterized protein (TIGR03000 family)